MKLYNICDYGARFCDVPQTENIQKAIDDCFLAGGGRVLIPRGIYLTGGLRLRSGVELYLEAGAILKGTRDPEDYFSWASDPLEPVTMEKIVKGESKKSRSAVSTSRWCNGLIRVLDAENVSIIGEKGSYLDGSNVFDSEGEEHYRGPHGISIWRSKNIRLEGYTFVHSSNWCHAIFQSQNIVIRDIEVLGGHDGVDLRTCDNVLVENSRFNTGDDAIAGFDNHDVVIRNCLLNSPCQGIRFAGNNVLFENCRANATCDFGFRHYMTEKEKVDGAVSGKTCRHEMVTAYSYYCDHRADLRKPAENITLKNCHFDSAKEMIRLEFDGYHRWCCNRSLRQIKFEDCSFSNLLRAGELWGDETEKVICHFKNVTIRCKEEGKHDPLFVAANFEKIIFEDCTIEGYEDPQIWIATDGEVQIVNSTPLKVRKASADECLDKHPWGIAIEDREKKIKYF